MDAGPVIVLETKLQPPPVRADVIARRRLQRRLDTALERTLTLLSAPAGSGKTTLLADWCEGLAEDVDVAWLSCDVADDDASRFGQYVVEALDRAGLDVTELLRTVRLDIAMPLDAIATALLNVAARQSRPILFVLDDYHVLRSAEIHHAVQLAVDRAPPSLHLVIASRTEPPLSVSRLRAQGLLNELRAGDLRFNSEESLDLLSLVAERPLDPAAASMLEHRTEGWAAGPEAGRARPAGPRHTGGRRRGRGVSRGTVLVRLPG